MSGESGGQMAQASNTRGWVATLRGRPSSGGARKPPRRRRPMRLYRPIGKWSAALTGLASIAAVFVAWWLATEVNGVNPLFLPSIRDVGNAAIEYAQNGLPNDVWASFLRIMIGFVLATVVALPVGILTGTYRRAEAALEPILGFIRYMPAVAFVPLTVIWVGVGENQKYLVIFIGVFFTEALMIRDCVTRIPRALIDVGYTLGFSDWKVLTRIVLHSSAPDIWDTLRINVGWAWTWLILAELIGANDGLGARIVLAQQYLQTDVIFVAILIIGLLGLVMDQAMKFAGRRLFSWAEEAR